MKNNVSIIGGGPSGLMAAEILSANGCAVTVYERKPTMAHKFLMAGRGGLNITHSEDLKEFTKKYNEQEKNFKKIIDQFKPSDLRAWCNDLGEETFIGSSGRIFPKSFKASPLLRAWLKRLEKQAVQFKMRHDWQGWEKDNLVFVTPEGKKTIKSDMTLLALGGASWPGLGADGSWVDLLKNENVKVEPLMPSNCGFKTQWSDIFKNRYAGHALKSVDLSFQDKKIRGEFIITEKGIEGGAVYALSAALRDEIIKNNFADLAIDLKPDLSKDQIIERLQKPKAKMSMSNYLKKTLNLSEVALGLLMELPDRKELNNYSPKKLSSIIKNYQIKLTDNFGIEKAISSAGGVFFDAVDENFMLKNKENVYVVGEMLDWEAPTGGYLLQACLSSGVHVANAMLKKLKSV